MRTFWTALLLLFVFAVGTGGWTASEATAQPRYEAGEEAPIRIGVRPYPTSLWGPTRGVGAALDLSVRNLGPSGSQLLLHAYPSQHRGTYSATYTTAPPFRGQRYLAVGARADVNDRHWYFGTGPGSSASTRLAANVHTFESRIRLGQPVFETGLVQPIVGVSHRLTRSFRNDDEDAFDALRPLSQRTLLAAAGELSGTERRQTHLLTGLALSWGTDELIRFQRSGVRLQSVMQRLWSVDDAPQIDRYTIDALGHLPVADRQAFTVRAHLKRTFGNDGTPVPFHFLSEIGGRDAPGYSRRRFVGNDALMLQAMYRFPLVQWRDAFVIEGHVAAHAVSVYNDILDEFELAVDFSETIDADRDTFPLRPAISTGIRLGPIFRDDIDISSAVGLSPEGVTAVHIRFVQPIQSLGAPFFF